MSRRTSRVLAAAVVAAAIGIAAACAPPTNVDHRTPANSPTIVSPLHMLVRPETAPDPLQYDGTGVFSTSRCSGGPTAAINQVAVWLNYWWPATTVGIYNCRPVGKTSTMSAHGLGRAVDLHYNANNPAERQRAEGLISTLLATDQGGHAFSIARRIGVQQIIWNRSIWTSNQNFVKRAYTGDNPHTDHVHIEISIGASQQHTSFFWGWNVLSCAPEFGCGWVRIGRYAS